MEQKIEIFLKKYVVCTINHMPKEDDAVLSSIMAYKLHAHNWIVEYEYGYIFDLWEGKYTLLRLKKIGISKHLRSFILHMIIKYAASLIQFDCYGDTVDTMPIFEWK